MVSVVIKGQNLKRSERLVGLVTLAMVHPCLDVSDDEAAEHQATLHQPISGLAQRSNSLTVKLTQGMVGSGAVTRPDAYR